jgi:hypothetical protein
MSKELKITLTEDEAWVLFELTRRFSDSNKLNIEDQSEERALWNLCCIFEKTYIKNKILNIQTSLRSAGKDSKMNHSKHITSGSNGQIFAVTFYAKKRIKAAIKHLRG